MRIQCMTFPTAEQLLFLCFFLRTVRVATGQHPLSIPDGTLARARTERVRVGRMHAHARSKGRPVRLISASRPVVYRYEHTLIILCFH